MSKLTKRDMKLDGIDYEWIRLGKESVFRELVGKEVRITYDEGTEIRGTLAGFIDKFPIVIDQWGKAHHILLSFVVRVEEI